MKKILQYKKNIVYASVFLIIIIIIIIITRNNKACLILYPYLNQNIICKDKHLDHKLSFEEKQIIVEEIDNITKREDVDTVSFYFRDLTTGFAWGVNEFQEFTPASLLKVPLAMVFLELIENDHNLYKQKIVYSGQDFEDYYQFIKPRIVAKKGVEYEIGTLLEYMIKYSDNYSYFILETFISEDQLRSKVREEVFQELGFIDPKSQELQTLTVRGYALLFRTLYNASFLDEELSQLLLNLLVNSDYKDALVAGVPTSVKVAHKFGERWIDNKIQLHDCGIVYHSDHPYIFCMMTRGEDPLVLQDNIKKVSNLVYNLVDNDH